MALIIKGVYDITRYIFNGILHVILRDLTNYYWYQEEEEQRDDTSVHNQTDNDGDLMLSNLNDDWNDLGFNQENVKSDIVNNNECDCLESNQDNTQLEFTNNNKFEDGSTADEILYVIDSVCSLNIQDNTPENFDGISIEDNSMIQNEEDNCNNLTSPINKNCIWKEIENYICENTYITNNDTNIIEEKSPQTFLETLGRENIANTPSENLEMELGEKLILQTNYKNLNDETNSNITSVKNTEKEHGLKICETEDNLNSDGERYIFELESGEKSDENSECELGLHNFQNQNLHDERPIVERSDNRSQMNVTCQSEMGKSKVSKYIHNTTLPSIKITKHPYSPELSTLKPPTNSLLEDIENEHLLLPTSNEINGIIPLLNRSEELSESQVTMKSELQNNPSEISSSPVCSNDSWDDWYSRFSSIIKPVTPTKNDDVSSIIPSSNSEEDEKETFCDCINSHSCLLNVDSDVDLAKDLLTAEQLGSVETGSVSDWLYRVNPPYPLLPTTRESERNPKEIQNTEEQEQYTNIQSESSEEDLAVKKFFIEQWLDKTETYNNTGLNAKFIGSGDIICG